MLFKVSTCLVLGLAVLVPAWRSGDGDCTSCAANEAFSPAFARQLDRNNANLAIDEDAVAKAESEDHILLWNPISFAIASGCATSVCGASGCGTSVCLGSACAGSACLGSGCAGSGCGGSACGLSGCAGSGCLLSACFGSACTQSGCLGSACIVSGCVGSACIGSVCGATNCVGSICVQSGCAASLCILRKCSPDVLGWPFNIALEEFYHYDIRPQRADGEPVDATVKATPRAWWEGVTS